MVVKPLIPSGCIPGDFSNPFLYIVFVTEIVRFICLGIGRVASDIQPLHLRFKKGNALIHNLLNILNRTSIRVHYDLWAIESATTESAFPETNWSEAYLMFASDLRISSYETNVL